MFTPEALAVVVKAKAHFGEPIDPANVARDDGRKGALFMRGRPKIDLLIRLEARARHQESAVPADQDSLRHLAFQVAALRRFLDHHVELPRQTGATAGVAVDAPRQLRYLLARFLGQSQHLQ